MTKQKTSPVIVARKPWVAPTLTRIGAGEAENGLNAVRSDGVISMGS